MRMTTKARPPWAERLRAERLERRWSQSAMARRLHAAVGMQHPTIESLTRQIRGWEKGDHFPEPYWQQGYALAFGLSEGELFGSAASVEMPLRSADPSEIVSSLTAEVIDLATWAEGTNVGDTTIQILADTTRRLATDYLRHPPVPVLREALASYRRTSELLRGGRQHLHQARDLHVIAGRLLAFLSWASSDLGQPAAAETYARAGWVMAEEADHDGLRSMILIARSKNAFWERRLHEAAAHARRGLEYAPANSVRILLACQLGDAYQELGDVERATEAHQVAARARDEIAGADELGGIWACGPARQANYAVWVHLRAEDSGAALAAVDTAEVAYAEGDQWAYGTWAQIRIGAGTAHLMADRLDGTSEALAPILEMRPEERLATLSSRLGDVAGMLNRPRYASSAEARALRDQIADYLTNSMTTKALLSGEQ